MSSVATVANVIEAFKQRGFEFVGRTDDGWFRLYGPLTPAQADKGWPCEVQLDPTFFDLPVVAGRKLTIYRSEFRLKFDQGV